MSKGLPFEVCAPDLPSVAEGEGESPFHPEACTAPAASVPGRCRDAVGVFTLLFLLSLFLFPGCQRLLLFQSLVSFA